MIKRSFAMLAIVVLALITSVALPSLSPTEAAGGQRSIWNTPPLQQTASTYWMPVLDQPADYTSPADLAGGHAYMRLDVIDKPSDLYVVPMICFWRHGAKQFQEETCAAGRKHPFTSEGTYYLDLGTPSSWWKRNGKFDWTTPASVARIMIRDGVPGGRLLLNERCGGACYLGDDLDDHVPITMSSQLIFVPKGQTLSPPTSWRGSCPASWASACRGDEPTPVTTVDPGDPVPSTTSPSPDPTSPPTTTGGSASIDALPGIESLEVAYRIPKATRFQVRFQPDGGSRKWTTPTEATSQTLRNLQGGTLHTVSVRGLINGTWRSWIDTTATPLRADGPNPGGTVAPTTTAAPVTTAPATTTPGSTFIDVVAGTSKLTVTYGVPDATLHQLRYRQDGKSYKWTEPTKVTTQTLNGLRAGKVHTVEVRGLVNGTWRTWHSTTATPLGAGSTPVGGLDIDISPLDRRLRIDWTLAGASTIQVRSKVADKSGWQWNKPTTDTVVTLTGLTNGTTYDVEVRALLGGTWQPWVAQQATPRK